MEHLKHIQKELIKCVERQMPCLETVNTKELGEVIDMIKDLSETIYYHTVTEAMEVKYEDCYGGDKASGGKIGWGHVDADSASATHHSDAGGYSEKEMHMMGRSPMSRKSYMESKEMHKEKTHQMQELEKYVQELAADLMEMIAEASPEEKQLLSNRIAVLATKIK